MRRIVTIIATGLLMFAAGAGPALAAAPSHVLVVANSVTAGPGLIGTFTADGGGLCPTGTIDEGNGILTGSSSSGHWNFIVIQTFVCDEGSGFTNDDSFTIRLQAHTTDGAPANWGTWEILDGTGTFSRVHGAGTHLGVYGEGGVTVGYMSGHLK